MDERRDWREILMTERLKLNIDEKKVAHHCGVDVETYIDWETGDEFPAGQTEKRLYGILPRMTGYKILLAATRNAPRKVAPPPPVPGPPKVAPPPPAPITPRVIQAPTAPATAAKEEQRLVPVKKPRQPFGEALREARNRAGYTCMELAKDIDSSKSAVSSWENGGGVSREYYETLCGLMPELREALEPRFSAPQSKNSKPRQVAGRATTTPPPPARSEPSSPPPNGDDPFALLEVISRVKRSEDVDSFILLLKAVRTRPKGVETLLSYLALGIPVRTYMGGASALGFHKTPCVSSLSKTTSYRSRWCVSKKHRLPTTSTRAGPSPCGPGDYDVTPIRSDSPPSTSATKNSRPTWDETCVSTAMTWAKRGTCPRLSVGAVITTPRHRVLVTGYNGALDGEPHCLDVGCDIAFDRCERTVHAEMNALVNAARDGLSVEGCTLYVTHLPCWNCYKHTRQAGISRVVYGAWYGSDFRAVAHASRTAFPMLEFKPPR